MDFSLRNAFGTLLALGCAALAMDELYRDRPKLAVLDALLAGASAIEAGVLGGKTKTGITTRPAANDDDASAKIAELNPGDKMPDGTIYAGMSPDTQKPMYTTPADAPLTMHWKAAMKYAEKFDAHGHKDWRVPTKREINVLFNNGAAIGGFNASGSFPAGWYWSSVEHDKYGAIAQRFIDGDQGWYHQETGSSLRCVR